MGEPKSKFAQIRKKAPQIIVIAIAIILCTYMLLEVLVHIFIKGAPISFTRTVSSWGYSGVFGLMILEASSLPIPSEIILPFAGYLVSLGHLDFWLTLIVATIAAIAGSLIDYFIGLKGFEVLSKYRLLGRAIISENQLKIAAGYFNKYGSAMVFVGRLIPAVRTLISFPAGAVRMPLAKFLAYTVAGCIIWNSLLIYVGYYLGNKWEEVAGVSHYLIIAVAATLVTGFVVYLVRRKKELKKPNRQAIQTNYLRTSILGLSSPVIPMTFASSTCTLQSTSDASFNTL